MKKDIPAHAAGGLAAAEARSAMERAAAKPNPAFDLTLSATGIALLAEREAAGLDVFGLHKDK